MRTPNPKTPNNADTKYKTPSRSSHSTAHTDRSVKEILRLQMQLQNEKAETKTLKLIIHHQKEQIITLKQSIKELGNRNTKCHSSQCDNIKEENEVMRQYINMELKEKSKNKSSVLLDDLLMMRLQNAHLKEQIETMQNEYEEKREKHKINRYVQRIRQLQQTISELKSKLNDKIKYCNRLNVDNVQMNKEIERMYDDMEEIKEREGENTKRSVIEIIRRNCPHLL